MDAVVRFEDIVRGLREAGLREHDALFFHSSLKSFGHVEGGADTVIDAALAAVGSRGMVVVPTFVQSVGGKRAGYLARQAAWDIERTPSDVGHITEVLRRRPDAVRSDHCCDSMAAIGPEAREVMGRHARAWGRPSPWDERSFGAGSPWEWLVGRNALYLLMGVEYDRCSLFHFVQALWQEDRYGLQSEGLPPEETARLVWPVFDFPEVGWRVEVEGLVTQVQVGNSLWKALRVRPVVVAALDALRRAPELVTEHPVQLITVPQ